MLLPQGRNCNLFKKDSAPWIMYVIESVVSDKRYKIRNANVTLRRVPATIVAVEKQ
jgi:hypothetical protein